MQGLFNATGYATDKKFELYVKQLMYHLGQAALEQFDVLDFQQ